MIYKKIASPDTSPVLGPATASPSIASKEFSTNEIDASASTVNPTIQLQMEPFSLCNCCCTSRNHNTNKPNIQHQQHQQHPQIPENVEPKYEFGHATHYTYNATTPRLICAFETGTLPPSIK